MHDHTLHGLVSLEPAYFFDWDSLCAELRGGSAPAAVRGVAQALAAFTNLVSGWVRLAGFENVASGRRWYAAPPVAALDLVMRSPA